MNFDLAHLKISSLSSNVSKSQRQSDYLSTSTRSSRSSAHLVFGQKTRTRQPASRLSSMWRAWASWFTV